MNHDEINCLMVDFLEKLCPAPLQIANTTPFSQFTYGFKQMTEYISKKRDEAHGKESGQNKEGEEEEESSHVLGLRSHM